MSSLRMINRTALGAALLLLIIGIGSLTASLRPLSPEQWQSTVLSGTAQAADYDSYLAANAEANVAKRQCAFFSMNGDVCALGGFVAPINWLGIIALAIGVGAFARIRMSGDTQGIYG